MGSRPARKQALFRCVFLSFLLLIAMEMSQAPLLL
jgi:hypothetical protein